MGNPLMTSLTGILISESLAETTLFKVSDIGRIGNFDTRDKLTRLCLTARVFEALKDQNSLDVYRLFCIWSAERVRHLLTDAISIKALDVCREYIAGTATLEELKEAATMAYVNNADTVSMHDLESNPPEQQGQHYAAYSVAMASTSLAFRSRPAFESAAYHAAMAMWRMYFSDESYEKERGIQLAKLMELLDRGVRNEAPSNLPNETGHEL